jgi:hypothetical protein
VRSQRLIYWTGLIFSISNHVGSDAFTWYAYAFLGAYRNPPQHMAELMREVILEFTGAFTTTTHTETTTAAFASIDAAGTSAGPAAGQGGKSNWSGIKRIAIAIIEDHNSRGEGNFKPFWNVFHGNKK